MDGQNRMLRGAAILDDQLPDVAAFLRRVVSSVESPDPRKLRRAILRRIWQRHFHRLLQTPAANEIAVQWKIWAARQAEDPDAVEELPDTLDYLFARLEREGVTPLSGRTIWEDLGVKIE